MANGAGLELKRPPKMLHDNGGEILTPQAIHESVDLSLVAGDNDDETELDSDVFETSRARTRVETVLHSDAGEFATPHLNSGHSIQSLVGGRSTATAGTQPVQPQDDGEATATAEDTETEEYVPGSEVSPAKTNARRPMIADDSETEVDATATATEVGTATDSDRTASSFSEHVPGTKEMLLNAAKTPEKPGAGKSPAVTPTHLLSSTGHVVPPDLVRVTQQAPMSVSAEFEAEHTAEMPADKRDLLLPLFDGDEVFYMAFLRCFKIDTIHPWQARAIKTLATDPTKNAVIIAPTSAGKTVVAAALLAQTVFAHRKQRAVWSTPLIAQAAEVTPLLTSLFAAAHMSVEGMYGSHKAANSDGSLYVQTFEKAASAINMLLQHHRANNISCVLVDEVHMIADPTRGATLELMMTKLRLLLPQTRIIAMSATFPNSHQLAEWLDANLIVAPPTVRPVTLRETVTMPARHLMRVMGTQLAAHGAKMSNRCLLERRGDELVPVGVAEKVDTTIIGKGPRDGGHHLSDAEARILRLPTNKRTYMSVSFCETMRLLQDVEGGTLVFCGSKAEAERMAVHCAMLTALELIKSGKRSQSDETTRQMLDAFSNLPFAPERQLVAVAPHHIAFHHAGLSEEERDIVVQGFRLGVIRVIFCTPTLASGVNLPSSTVIITRPMIAGMNLDATRYRQIAGRAGRFGLDATGRCHTIIPQDGWTLQQTKGLVCDLARPVLSSFVQPVPGQGQQLHLNRPVLEALLFCPNSVDSFLRHTFYFHTIQNDAHAGAWFEKVIATEITRLTRDSFVEGGEPSKLGAASVRAGFSPEMAIEMYKSLGHARKRCRLDDELFLLFHVAPTFNAAAVVQEYMMRPIHPMSFRGRLYTILSELPIERFNVIVCDILGPFLHDLIQTAPPASGIARIAKEHTPVGVLTWALGVPNEGVSDLVLDRSTWPLLHGLMRALHRLHAALLMTMLIDEIPLDVIVERMGYRVAELDGPLIPTRGDLQKLMKEAGQMCAMVHRFCEGLSWNLLGSLVHAVAPRLEFGVQVALIDLVNIPGIRRDEARALYRCGISAVPDVIAAGRDRVYQALGRGLPFTADRGVNQRIYERSAELLAAAMTLSGESVVEQPDGSYLLLNSDMQAAGVNVEQPAPARKEILPYQIMNRANLPSPDDRLALVRLALTNGASYQAEESESPREDDNPLLRAALDDESAQPPPRGHSAIRPLVGPQFTVPLFPPPPVGISLQSLEYPPPAPPTMFGQRTRLSVLRLSAGDEMFSTHLTAVVDRMLAIPPGDTVGIVAHADPETETLQSLVLCGIPGDVVVVTAPFPNPALADILRPLLSSTRVRKSLFLTAASLPILLDAGLALAPPMVDPAAAAWMLDVNIIHRDSEMKRTIKNPTEMSWQKVHAIYTNVDGSVWSGNMPVSPPVEPAVGKALSQAVLEAHWCLSFGSFLCSQLDAAGLLDVHDRVFVPFALSTGRMRWRGVMVNCSLGKQLTAAMQQIRAWNNEAIVQKVVTETSITAAGFNINSVDCLRKLLYTADGYGFKALKFGRPTKSGVRNPSTDKAALKMLLAGPEGAQVQQCGIVAMILRDRNLKKIMEMVNSPLALAGGNATMARLRSDISLCRTYTGRLAFDQPNFQNFANPKTVTLPQSLYKRLAAEFSTLPAATPASDGMVELPLLHRSLVCAGEGNVLLSIDYNQLEFRLLAHLADDMRLKKLLTKADPFVLFAADLYHKDAADVTPEERGRAKQCVYAIMYGQGLTSMSRSLGIDRKEAGALLMNLFGAYPGLKLFREKVCRFMVYHGDVFTLLGRTRDFNDAVFRGSHDSNDSNAVMAAIREAINTVVQGSAADILMAATTRAEAQLEKAGLGQHCFLVLNMHDELIWEVAEGKANQAAAVIMDAMTHAVMLTVPLTVKCRVGPRWSEMQPLEL
ncbi:DNA polymerase theta, POLQ [Carpediemonas membranifera]|uniref:DNA-directed DNA polymerase n=1 Tax=Carpediemonas membranifera TaxID=201153 RepID=A0A8J6B5D7_9EUKA|nr:DNA polymerase theta, POLQ [Carpediemonas membranifera]|eukprot:KAG9394639.1 DNA polymerase theta, POLQ [Carpediemonas membranifera]